MKCPVCNNECDTRIIDTLDGRPVEVKNECISCFYNHSYAYGYTSTSIGGVHVDRSYRDSNEVSELKGKIIDIAIQIAKEEAK